MLGEAEIGVLRRLFIDYGSDIDTKDLIEYLEIKGDLNEDQAESIKNKTSNRERQLSLMRIMMRQTRDGLDSIVPFFEESSQIHICDWLKGSLKDIEDGGNGRRSEDITDNERRRVKTMLISSRVPTIKKEIVRKSLLNEVCCTLKSLSNEDSFFLVLHGLPGSGKSSLAAALVRQEDIVPRYFETIVWIDDSLSKEKQFTLLMIDLLVHLSDSPPKEYPPIDNAHVIYFTKLISEALNENPRILIVIDNVMTYSTVSWIDHLNVRVVATTRNALLFDDVSQRTKIIPIRGFEENEVKEVVSYDGMEVDDTLNRRIFDLTEGLPAFIRMILKLSNGNNKRLSEWISRIDKNGLYSISASTSYNKDCMKDAMEEHYSMVPNELKDVLHSIVAFPFSIPIPLEVWSLVVPIDVVDNEDIIPELSHVMNQLSKNCWVDLVDGIDSNKEYYTVPRMVHQFLKDKMSESDVKSKKEVLLNRGNEYCGDNDWVVIIKNWFKTNSSFFSNSSEGSDSTIQSLVNMICSMFSWVGLNPSSN